MSNSSENPVFDIALAYQKTAALIAAVKLDIFTIIGSETMSLADLVSRTGAAGRGLRILCDYLTVLGLLKKQRFALLPDTYCPNISRRIFSFRQGQNRGFCGGARND